MSRYRYDGNEYGRNKGGYPQHHGIYNNRLSSVKTHLYRLEMSELLLKQQINSIAQQRNKEKLLQSVFEYSMKYLVIQDISYASGEKLSWEVENGKLIITLQTSPKVIEQISFVPRIEGNIYEESTIHVYQHGASCIKRYDDLHIDNSALLVKLLPTIKECTINCLHSKLVNVMSQLSYYNNISIQLQQTIELDDHVSYSNKGDYFGSNFNPRLNNDTRTASNEQSYSNSLIGTYENTQYSEESDSLYHHDQQVF